MFGIPAKGSFDPANADDAGNDSNINPQSGPTVSFGVRRKITPQFITDRLDRFSKKCSALSFD
jgi:hypothetical protein